MSSNRKTIFLLIILLGGCGEDPATEMPAELMVTSLPGVYSGEFPCEGCPGIPTTVWLSHDGRFFFEQHYPATESREAINAHSLGRWNWIADDQVLVLKGVGPVRTFTSSGRNTLDMRTASELEHRLARVAGAANFTATLGMSGMMRVNDGAFFTECLTGYEVPVDKGGDFRRFVHQYRSAGSRAKPVFVELEGRFSWNGDGKPKLLTIERFITIKAEGHC